MRRLFLLAVSLLLLAGCGQGASPLLPGLQGRWAPEKGAQARLSLASTNSSVPIKTPTTQDLCQSEYITFQKFPAASDLVGAVFLHRHGKRDAVLLVREAKREGERVILTGRQSNHPAQIRLELILRNGAIAFDNIIDQRGRSLRYDLIKSNDPVRTQRAGITTVGDVFRMMFDLKSCVA